jgi:hypothetical protein
MDEHLSIFDDLYDIKDNISDGNFLILNNKLKNLVQQNKNFREFLRKNLVSDDGDNPEIIEQHIQFLAENEYESEEESEEELEYVCSCSTRYVFPDLLIFTEDITNFFCLSSLERMQNCENFKRLMMKLPLLENLFRKVDLPFAEEPIYNEYIKEEIVLIVKILLLFIEKFSEKKNKSIIIFIIYDFMIKNINFMKDNQIYANKTLKKYEELLNDRDYVKFAIEYNVNYTRWIDIIKSIILVE